MLLFRDGRRGTGRRERLAWTLLRLFLVVAAASCVSGMRVIHPLPGSTVYTHEVIVSAEFWPGLVPSEEFPLHVRFTRRSARWNISAVATDFGKRGVPELYTGVYEFEVDLLARMREGDADPHSDADPGSPGHVYNLEMRLGKDWNNPMSERMVRSTHFTLLTDRGCAAITSAASASASASASTDPTSARVVDTFPFFGSRAELDILEMRLFELNSVVDAFLLVESTTTHSGRRKALHWQEALDGPNASRWDPWLDKIIAVVVDIPLEEVEDDGFNSVAISQRMVEREETQRDAIRTALEQLACASLPGASSSSSSSSSSSPPAPAPAIQLPFGALRPHDIILVTDADEVPSSRAINALRHCWPWRQAPPHQDPSSSSPRQEERVPSHEEVLQGATGSLHVRLLLSWFQYSTDWRSSIPWGFIAAEGPFAARAALLLPAAAFTGLPAGADSNPAPPRSPGASAAAASAAAAAAASSFSTTTTTTAAPTLASGGTLPTDLRRFQRKVEEVSRRLGPDVLGSWSVLRVFRDDTSGGGGIRGGGNGTGGVGWHFSSFGGVQGVQEKLEAYIGAASFTSRPESRELYGQGDRLKRLLRHGIAYYDLSSLAVNSVTGLKASASGRGSSDSSVGGGDAGEEGYTLAASLTHFERVRRSLPGSYDAAVDEINGEDARAHNYYATDRSLPRFLLEGLFRSQGREGAFVSLFEESAGGGGGGDGDTDDTDDTDGGGKGSGEKTATQEAYLLLQDIRKARLLAVEESHYRLHVVDGTTAGTVGEVSKQRMLRRELAVNCAAPEEPWAAVLAFCQENGLGEMPEGSSGGGSNGGGQRSQQTREEMQRALRASIEDSAEFAKTLEKEFTDMADSHAPPCEQVLLRAETGCRGLLSDTVHSGSRGDKWWRETIDLDMNIRVSVATEDGEIHMVEIQPWDDLKQLARDDGAGMGLTADQIGTLEEYLRSKANEVPAFVEQQKRWQQ